LLHRANVVEAEASRMQAGSPINLTNSSSVVVVKTLNDKKKNKKDKKKPKKQSPQTPVPATATLSPPYGSRDLSQGAGVDARDMI
jgi:hypothetical protein